MSVKHVSSLDSQGLFQAELYIEDLKREDEGEYSCQVLVKDF